MPGEQRFVISARVIGGARRDSPKLKMFMVSVLWSDENEVIIYRSFQDFKTFHSQLKKKFPHLNPFRKNDRMIPKFRGKALRSSIKQKGSKKSVRQMRFLESYCGQLLKCDQSVTQSSEITRFFTPKDHDLQPNFTKNSILIMLSGDLSDESGGGGENDTRQQANISHPFIAQTYYSLDAYETKDTKNRPFKVALDEKLEVLIKDPEGWWLVENGDRCQAWFPAPLLKLWEGEDDRDAGFQLTGALYCAVRGYSTDKKDEVSVPFGSVVEVLRKSDDGWWLIRFNGKTGYIPSMNLQPYNNPRAGLYSLQRKLRSSSLNLTTSQDSQASYPASISEENGPEQDSAGPSSREPSMCRCLHKTQSLDILSESWSQTQTETDASTSDRRIRSMSNTSTESRFSDFSSSSSDSSSVSNKEVRHQSHAAYPAASSKPGVSDSSRSIPDLSPSNRSLSKTSSDSFGSVRSKGSETTSVVPRMPCRPKTEDILKRCTTITRKAALANKTRLQMQSEPMHNR
ncbi:NADPH oxidase organizer 1-like [Brachyistius frenatus]|uniref:NADPH oxidase organizer 1-like n=1 Tax=Brachyistius frenatus TaxID=100188 RepID=UPI0037E962A0